MTINKACNMESLIEQFFSKKGKELIRQNKLILKNLNKQFNKDLFKDLELIYKPEIVMSDGRIFNAGDIVFRPLDGLKDDYNLDFNHYGIVLGTSLNNEKLFLHTTAKHNIRIVNLRKFLSKHKLEEIGVKRKPENVSFEEIIERAKEVKNEMYSVTNFNCKHFVNYCVYGKRECDAVQNISTVVSPLLDLINSYLKYKSEFQTEVHKDSLVQLSKKIEKMNQEIKLLK